MITLQDHLLAIILTYSKIHVVGWDHINIPCISSMMETHLDLAKFGQNQIRKVEFFRNFYLKLMSELIAYCGSYLCGQRPLHPLSLVRLVVLIICVLFYGNIWRKSWCFGVLMLVICVIVWRIFAKVSFFSTVIAFTVSISKVGRVEWSSCSPA
eukprot:124556_1